MIQQDFESADEILEYAAKLIEDTDLSDLAGVWAKKKRNREDAELRLRTAEDVRKRCASHIRAMKKRPELGPVGTLRELAGLSNDSYMGHVMHLRDAWPLAWKGWVNIECILKTNSNGVPPETEYRIVLTDKGRDILAAAPQL
jgi:hypothetical protein